MNRVLIACAVLFASPVIADDKKPEPKGEPVQGMITFKGKPLPGGTVTFVSKDAKVKIAAMIAEDGTYKATVPAGKYRVTVSTEVEKKKDDPKDPPKPLPAIPKKYSDPDTSGLVITVKKGKQTFEIDLN